MATSTWGRLVRFSPKGDSSKVLIGEPEDQSVDVGFALYSGKEVTAKVYSGSSLLDPGTDTGSKVTIGRALSPLTQKEVGTIRCIGLNYKQHAAEVGLDLPTVPTLFMKPETALADPWPSMIALPKLSQSDNCADYESELAVVIGKDCKNVSESEALDYVLGYTAANDVSSRSSQFAQSQWCFSKGFDGSCPIGPVLVSPALIPDVSKLQIRGLRNGELLQDCSIDVPKLVSFLSQSTRLPAGTVIITGTPAGVGTSKKPKVTIQAGDEFFVEITPHIGSLINKFENET